jgi:hypothetical protein
MGNPRRTVNKHPTPAEATAGLEVPGDAAAADRAASKGGNASWHQNQLSSLPASERKAGPEKHPSGLSGSQADLMQSGKHPIGALRARR